MRVTIFDIGVTVTACGSRTKSLKRISNQMNDTRGQCSGLREPKNELHMWLCITNYGILSPVQSRTSLASLFSWSIGCRCCHRLPPQQLTLLPNKKHLVTAWMYPRCSHRCLSYNARIIVITTADNACVQLVINHSMCESIVLSLRVSIVWTRLIAFLTTFFITFSNILHVVYISILKSLIETVSAALFLSFVDLIRRVIRFTGMSNRESVAKPGVLYQQILSIARIGKRCGAFVRFPNIEQLIRSICKWDWTSKVTKSRPYFSETKRFSAKMAILEKFTRQNNLELRQKICA